MAERVNFDVDGFKARLTGGGSRPNQFFVQLTFPTYVQLSQDAAQNAPFLVTAASLPGSTVNPAVVMYRGREVKLGGERTFNPWTISIINDNSFVMRNAFEDWMNGINDRFNNGGRIQPSQYMTDLTVTQMDRNNNPLKAYKIKDAFPIDVSDVQLDFGANDQISQFSVSFAYQTFDTNQGAPLTNPTAL